ncbi:hypothetical protein LUZ63_020445 [Rhynchospora breviuscula]|uniref:Uncharacterized protein n=1 Tax=Rhynchospora breviuscula TaxID=2022672 RepID=A0A9Q0C0R6_9POAL|nr:hypothetical protein LUZ63_020445 [Rhynchospora breviuscula]
MEGWYPARWAEDWDAVGLVCGDPDADVRRVLLAVDPVLAVADEAVAGGADLVITHHPLFLRGTHSVAATTPKGRVVHRLTGAGCALLAAHTNADSPAGGVSESLALALGLTGVEPLQADETEPVDKVVVFVPATHAEEVRRALSDAGAGRIGDYADASFSSPGEGRFRPLEGASPAIGEVGRAEVVDEVRIEVVSPAPATPAVLRALRAAHPYEEPAYDVTRLLPADEPDRGSGRIGVLAEPEPLRAFAERVAGALPATAHGVRVAGDPERQVRTVALCGGAGDFLLDTARARGADVYLTSDLRHHPASEHTEHAGAPALVDVAHWAAEWTWLPVLRARLEDALGDSVAVSLSTTSSDPWTFRELDTRADTLAHRLRTLPEIAEQAAAEAEHRTLFDAKRDLVIAVDDLTAEQRRADRDVEQVRARRERDQGRMDAGQITNPKDLERMSGELESLQRRIATLEDEELEVMERLEETQGRLDDVLRHLDAAQDRAAAAAASRQEKSAALQNELADVAAQREQVVPDLPEDLLALYERLRSSKGGTGAALLRRKECGGCRLTLNPADLNAVVRAPEDEVVRCEECDRILGHAPTRLVLVRHGVTAHTAAKRFSGGLSGTNPPLTDEGRAQVAAAARVVEALLDGPADVLVTSPVRRTVESAAVLGERLGLPVTEEPGLAETDFGGWEGLTFAEVREQHPDQLDAWLGSLDEPAGGTGESCSSPTPWAHRWRRSTGWSSRRPR